MLLPSMRTSPFAPRAISVDTHNAYEGDATTREVSGRGKQLVERPMKLTSRVERSTSDLRGSRRCRVSCVVSNKAVKGGETARALVVEVVTRWEQDRVAR